MKTEVKKIDQHKRQLSIQVEGDIVKEKFDAVYKKINKEAKIPGFRAGNVPLDLLEKHYSSVAQQEILKELVPEVYKQALGEVDLEPVGLPEISQINLGKYNLSFRADVEVKPKVDVKNYKGLKVEYRPVQVSDDEISKAVDTLRQNRSAKNQDRDKKSEFTEEELVHSLGYPDLAALKSVLEKQIYLEKARTQQISLENSVIEQLLAQVNFQVSPTLVSQQSDRLLKQAELELTLRGMNKEEVDKQRQALKKNLAPEAEKQVRIFLVLEEVARRENIACDDKMTQRVVEFLLQEANWKNTRKSLQEEL